MQILDIILYGDGDRVRRLPLRLGDVNIITGASGTGKSALLQIVEYTLGRDEFLVPEGPISRDVRWYGLRLQFPKTQILVARRSPDAWQKSTGEMYFEVGANLAIPPSASLVPNTNPKDLNLYLTRLLEIAPNLHIPDENQTRRPLEVTLRHALTFVFQSQNEIAKNSILFHRQDDFWVAQGMKDGFPYFLGAVDEKRLEKSQEVKRLKKRVTQLERKAKETSDVLGRGHTKGLSLITEAESVGLLSAPSEGIALPEDTSRLRAALAPVMSWTPQEPPAIPDDVLSRLQIEYNLLLEEYRRCEDRIRAMRQCEEGQKGFAVEAREQRARLAFVNIYQAATDGEAVGSSCPLCQSELPVPVPAATEVAQSLEKITAQLTTVATERPRLREHIDAQENQLGDLKRRMNEIRGQMRSATVRIPDLQNLMAINTRAAEVKGRISLYLESLDEVAAVGGNIANAANDNTEMEGLREEVKALEDELLGSDPEELLLSIQNILSKTIAVHAQELKLEYSHLPLRLDLKKLIIVADDPERGPIPLDRIGSGANWVGYHLAVYLALHEWFILRKRPVPRFLFLDQPTQVYFPRDRDEKMQGAEEALQDDDRAVVRGMFEWVVKTVQKLSPNLQVIILEHADLRDDWYQERVVERWRDGAKLVPAEWIDDKGKDQPSDGGMPSDKGGAGQPSLFDSF